ncbi:MAG: hypothetical protein QNJ60_13565 [Xenococcaceae cyanobacterium MO_188.B19]|nr:hypothetical protein [Xenococcaceae cyanobacterium MO_188.B19]
MANKPVKETSVYSEKNPRGYHWIKIWNSEKVSGKYSFSIAFGSGVVGAIPGMTEDAPYQFGCFDTPDEAITAAKSVVTN